MKIINETELMSNQKASTTVLPDVAFEALQTSAGTSLLFSISSENIFYCTYEVPGDTHGWQRTNLSDTISKNDFGGASITVKGFDLGQDLNAGTIDIVLAITAKDTDGIVKDWLYVSLANPDANWGNYIPAWQQVKFDDPNNTAFALCQINDVFVANFGSNQFIFADVVSNSTAQTLSRYAIDPTGGVMLNVTGTAQCWIPHATQMTLQAGHISSTVGCGPEDESVNGIYTLFSSDGNPQLVYAPLFNPNDPGGAPFPTDFVLPDGSDNNYMAMDVSKPSAASPDTDLFFASNGALYFAPNASQINVNGVNPSLKQIYTHDLFNNIQSITVKNWESNIVLWGQSIDPDDMQTSRLFVMECAAGHETNADAWSTPIPILVNVKNSTSYVHDKYSAINKIDADKGNAYGSCTVMFAHQQDGSLVQLFQDPVTTAWQERSLLTEPLDVQTEIYDTTTYSTHIEITDDNNLPQQGYPVSIWSSSPCSVYITDANNTAAYFNLDPVKPLKLITDLSGNIGIMQPVDSIGGISYYVSVQDTDPETKAPRYFNQAINPLATTITNLKAVVPDDNSDHLASATVTDEYGTETPLVDTSKYGDSTGSTSNSIYTICQQNDSVNADGLATDQQWPNPAAVSLEAVVKKVAKADRPLKNVRFNPHTDRIWAWTFGKNARHYEGQEALNAMGIRVNADNSLSFTLPGAEVGSLKSIEAKAGHIFKWMKSEVHKFEKAVVTVIDDVVDCIIHIAGEAYHFIAKCANDIVNLVHTVLNAIETAFEDVVKWVGMIFNFQDILRTHSVLKSVINIYLDYAKGNIATLDTDITNVFASLKAQVDEKTGLPVSGWSDSTQTYNGGMQKSTTPKGSKSPSANYCTHHLKNNAGSSSNDYNPDQSQILDTIFDELANAIKNEGTAFTDAAVQIKAIAAQVTDGKTTFTTVICNLMGVIVDLLLNTAENFLHQLIAVLQTLMSSVRDVMNATIKIPILSYLYKKMTKSKEYPDGQDLTALDLSCLISAIPITVIYKLVKNQPPFPAGKLTDDILNATDMDSLAVAVANLENVSSVAPGLLGHGQKGNMTPLNIASSLAATFGAIGLDLCLLVKSNLPPEMDEGQTQTNKIFSCLNAVGYMQYLLPDLIGAIQTWSSKDSQPWYTTMNNICTCIGGAKTMVDAGSAWFTGKLSDAYGKYVSPGADFLLNVAWQVPTIFTLMDQVETPGKWVEADINYIVGFVGGTAFDMSGIASPMLAESYFFMPPGEQRIAEINAWVGVISLLNVVWAGSCMATTFDGIKS